MIYMCVYLCAQKCIVVSSMNQFMSTFFLRISLSPSLSLCLKAPLTIEKAPLTIIFPENEGVSCFRNR